VAEKYDISLNEKRKKEMEIFNIVLEAQQKAIKVIKPGIKASYVDKVAAG